MIDLGTFGSEHPGWAVLACVVLVAAAIAMAWIADRGRTRRRAIDRAEPHGPELLRAVLERLRLCGPDQAIAERPRLPRRRRPGKWHPSRRRSTGRHRAGGSQNRGLREGRAAVDPRSRGSAWNAADGPHSDHVVVDFVQDAVVSHMQPVNQAVTPVHAGLRCRILHEGLDCSHDAAASGGVLCGERTETLDKAELENESAPGHRPWAASASARISSIIAKPSSARIHWVPLALIASIVAWSAASSSA